MVGYTIGRKMIGKLQIELYKLVQYHQVEFIKVKGHSDNEYNNRCDELARNAIKNLE